MKYACCLSTVCLSVYPCLVLLSASSCSLCLSLCVVSAFLHLSAYLSLSDFLSCSRSLYEKNTVSPRTQTEQWCSEVHTNTTRTHTFLKCLFNMGYRWKQGKNFDNFVATGGTTRRHQQPQCCQIDNRLFSVVVFIRYRNIQTPENCWCVK